MRKLLSALILTLLLLSACLPALAEQRPDVSMMATPSSFTRPGEVTVSIRVANRSGEDMPGPCALYGPDGSRIADFGTPTLAAGEEAVWTGTWQVTQEQLRSGKIVFALMYTSADSSGELSMKTQPFYTPVQYVAEAPRSGLARAGRVCIRHFLLTLR